MSKRLSTVLGGSKLDYYKRLLKTTPFLYYPMDEASGTTADNLMGVAALDGTYTNCTLGQGGIGDGKTAVAFDGTNSFLSIPDAALTTALNTAEGSLMIWVKPTDGTVWTDGAKHEIVRLESSSNNYIAIEKQTTNNLVKCYYKAGGVAVAADLTLSSTSWINIMITWSVSGDALIAYVGGAKVGSTVTGLGTWAGAFTAGRTLIGSTYVAPTTPWRGWIAHTAIWSRVLTPAEVAGCFFQ